MSDSPPNTITLTVPGMGSDHCAGIVRKTLERLDGVGEDEGLARARRAGESYAWRSSS